MGQKILHGEGFKGLGVGNCLKIPQLKPVKMISQEDVALCLNRTLWYEWCPKSYPRIHHGPLIYPTYDHTYMTRIERYEWYQATRTQVSDH